jgi:hypothetical protein
MRLLAPSSATLTADPYAKERTIFGDRASAPNGAVAINRVLSAAFGGPCENIKGRFHRYPAWAWEVPEGGVR